MLRPNFLRTLSDWVAEQCMRHEAEVEKASGEFGLDALIQSIGAEKASGVFSEWLTFDRKSAVFGGHTGLEYFVQHNPLHLSAEDMSAYADMLQFKVGMFSIDSVEGGVSVTLADMEDRSYVVHDVTASMHLSHGAVWARIASVGGLYHMVCCLFISVPFSFGPGYKRDAIARGEQSMDVREAAQLWLSRSATMGNTSTAKSPDQDTDLTHAQCVERRVRYRKEFEYILRSCGMRDMFTADTFEKWLSDERRFDMGFAMKALFYLQPDTIAKKDTERLFDIAMRYSNVIPRPSLRGKCPAEAKASQTKDAPEERGLIQQEIYTFDPYMEEIEQAHRHMKAHEWRQAYDTFEHVVRRLLEDKVPSFMAFRIFGNAAVACFAAEDGLRAHLGEQITLAALRLNPHYDFALRLKREQIDPYEKISGLPKENRELVESLRTILSNTGERAYRRTPFRKYEDFLQKCGISLSFDTHSKITEIRTPKTGAWMPKQGRNDPCACGSGKKHKKCCGSNR